MFDASKLSRSIRKKNYDKIAFIDESGTEGIPLPNQIGNTKFYVVGYLLVDYSNLDSFDDFLKDFLKRNFKSDEMKSRNIRGDTKKRCRLLDELFSYDYFEVGILIANKLKLKNWSKGFAYPSSFIKNIQGRLYNSLNIRPFNTLIIADRIKREKFDQEFSKYISKAWYSTFWDRRDIERVDSKDFLGVQAIDLICGSVLRGLEYKDDQDVFKCISGKSNVFTVFEPNIEPGYLFDVGCSKDEEFDKDIALEAYEVASEFIRNNNSSKKEADLIKVYCLKKLVDQICLGNDSKWVKSTELLAYINHAGNLNISMESLKNNIGKLKDRGMLIASRSGEGGYKLPTCVKDLNLFIENMGNKIVPMLARMKKARDIVKKSSKTDFDIIGEEPIYKELISAYEQVKLEQYSGYDLE